MIVYMNHPLFFSSFNYKGNWVDKQGARSSKAYLHVVLFITECILDDDCPSSVHFCNSTSNMCENGKYLFLYHEILQITPTA